MKFKLKRMITIEGYDVPNKITELTINQFDKLNNIESQTDLDSIEKWLMKFHYLGIPEDVFDDMPLSELQKHIQAYNEAFDIPTEKVLSVEINGYTYEASEILGAKDMSLIEKSWKHNVGNFGSDAMAIIFKRSDLSRTEHYAMAHLKEKAKLFREQSASLAVPFITDIIKSLTNSVDNAVTEGVE